MTLRIDHFFILCEPGAPEAKQLVEAGFVEGAPNVHPGQGTANRRFFFDDTGLELLYVSDRSEALSGPGKDLRIVQRSESASASPFGIVVDAGAAEPPFDTWEYWPEYFDGRHFFNVGKNSSQIDEPLCVCMPADIEPLERPRSDNPGLLLTSLEVALPSQRVSKPNSSV